MLFSETLSFSSTISTFPYRSFFQMRRPPLYLAHAKIDLMIFN